MLWTQPGVNTHYRNSKGRGVVPSPWRVCSFWEMTRTAAANDFVDGDAATSTATRP